jgi:hypothetical protein
LSIQDDLLSIGKEGIIRVNSLEVSVIIRDVRIRQLVLDFLVEPTAGTGETWVESNKIKIL